MRVRNSLLKLSNITPVNNRCLASHPGIPEIRITGVIAVKMRTRRATLPATAGMLAGFLLTLTLSAGKERDSMDELFCMVVNGTV